MDSPQITAVAADTSDPRAGLRAVASLRTLADVLELRQVEAALRAGMSWQHIADAPLHRRQLGKVASVQ